VNPSSHEALLRTLFPQKLGKAQLTQMLIIEAAIESYGVHGIENATPEKIAQKSKVSRPLILHYFKNNKTLFEKSMEYVRANFQRLAIEAIQKESKAKPRLWAYLDSTFDWVNDYPQHANVWHLFFYYVTLDKKLKRLHGEWVAMGQQRIAGLIQQGIAERVWKCANPMKAAKMIQVLITGALVTSNTEAIDTKLLRKDIKQKALECIQTA
jgi:AcrR family transcriptional regulator